MQIKGEQNPKCRWPVEYTFEWNETITKAITFYVTALRGSALFIMPDGTYTNIGKKLVVLQKSHLQ